MLKDILKAEYIKINESCNDWEDAINHAGNILLEKGIVTQEYIDCVIKSVKLFGPQDIIRYINEEDQKNDWYRKTKEIVKSK